MHRYCLIIIFFASFSTYAGISPTWTGNANTTWSNKNNWSGPATAPGSNASPYDMAIFANNPRRTTAINTGDIILNTLQFKAGITNFTIRNNGDLTLAGTGISNNSSNTQFIENNKKLNFINSCDAGSKIIITNNPAGTINFKNNATAVQATIVNNGDINIAALSGSSITIGSISGAGNIILGAKELRVGALNTSTTISGVISGVNGQLTKIGTGTLLLTGNNTYTGTTAISSGTLQIGDGGTKGSISSNIIDDAALVFKRSDTLIYDGIISGTGSLTQVGKGKLILTGNNTYTGPTIISAGELQIGDSAVASENINNHLSTNITNNSFLSFNRNDDVIYSGIISGSGSVTQAGAGTLILSNTNTYTGGTTISAGTLQIGNGSTTGGLTGDIVDQTMLVFNRTDSLTFPGIVTGTGTMMKLGASTLTLTGNNTYTGSTTLSAGTLQIGDGGTTGNISSDIINNSALVFNRSNTIIYDHVISGSGSLTKLGPGMLTLNNSNLYTGATNINDGTLRLGDATHPKAAITSDVNINPNGILGGYGTINGSVFNNGIVAPGASIGTLNIHGDYTQSPTANFQVEVDSNGNSDLLNITGVATLNGTISVDATQGFSPTAKYTILTAKQIIGRFTNTDMMGNFTRGFAIGDVLYLPNAIQLALRFNAPLFLQTAQTPNQIAVAKNILATNGTVAIQNLLINITTPQQFRNAMDQISAATYANQTLELAYIDNWFADQISDRFSVFPMSRQTMCQKNYSVNNPIWITGYGSHDQLRGGIVSGLTTNPRGIALGFEWPLNTSTGIGASVGYNHFQSQATGSEIASNEGDLFQLGLYGRYQIGPWLFGAAASIGRAGNISAQRQIQRVTELETTTGNYYANLFSQQLRAVYDLNIKLPVMIRPFLGIINQQVNRGNITEQGSQGFLLNVDGNSYHSLRSQLGILLESPSIFSVQPFVSISWEHEYADHQSSFNARLTGLNESFHIVGATISRDAALIKAGILVQQNKWFISALYEGRFATAWRQNGGKAQMNFSHAIW